MQSALTIFAGRCGDRNPRAMAGASVIGERIAERLGIAPALIGTPEPPLATGWREELDAALPALHRFAQHLDSVIGKGLRPVTTAGRCAASLATLPVIARHFPDAAVVWFDAHADSNVPESSDTGYLGGLVLTGAAGLWPTGLGDALRLDNVILVGTRDLDPFERNLMERGTLKLVPPGKTLPDALRKAIGERPVYIHLDCDVLMPGLVPSDYQVEGGLSLAELRNAFEILAGNDVVGLEIAEYEDRWAATGKPGHPDGLMDAIDPVLQQFRNSEQTSPAELPEPGASAGTDT
ncbi:arginase family protein [Pararhizobium polonicum]|uniref:arginase family protein n=1 Tax=Pararhizobium polonicum TaxID=1612624 RepID=UPI00083B1DAA|nr:arginase family protein [Pararhizobium polonicum]